MAPMTGIETRPRATIEDYLALPDDVRAELLGGELVLAPAPHLDHQAVLLALVAHIREHVHASQAGRVWPAPVDVHLPTGDVVQPDIVYIRAVDGAINRGSHLEGAPDLLIEVLSPGGLVRDRVVKRDLYARSGVAEYWIVDLAQRVVDVYLPEGPRYARPLVHSPGHVITSHVLPDLQLPVASVFEDLTSGD